MPKTSRIPQFFRKRWKMLLFIAAVVLVGFFIVRSRSQKAGTELKFVQVQRQDVVKQIEVTGVIDAKEKVSLRFLNGGKVTYIGAKEGDVVKRWQTLARIDARDLQKRLQQSLNTYFNQRMDFEQSSSDLRDKALTTTDERVLKKDQKTLENQVLSVEISDIAVSNTTLSTPIEGVLVSAPSPVAGVNVLASDTFEVVNPKSLTFRATVGDADIALIKKGQVGEITLDAYPEASISSIVNYISYKSAQSSTGTVFVVELPIPLDYQHAQLERYRIGMNGNANILVEKKEQVLAIPLISTKGRDGKTLVTVRKGEKNGKPLTEEKEIQIGLETDDLVEVTGGLTEQDQVVIP